MMKNLLYRRASKFVSALNDPGAGPMIKTVLSSKHYFKVYAIRPQEIVAASALPAVIVASTPPEPK